MAEEHESPQPSLDVVEILRRRGALLLWRSRGRGADRRRRRLPIDAALRLARRAAGRAAERLRGAVRSMVQNRPEARVRIITQRVLTNDNLQTRSSPRTASTRSWRACRPRRAAASATISNFRPKIRKFWKAFSGRLRPEGALAFSVSFTRSVAARRARRRQRPRGAVSRGEPRGTARASGRDDPVPDAGGDAGSKPRSRSARSGSRSSRTKNAGALPELAESNLQMLDRAGRDLDAVEQEIRTLRERQQLYTSELALLSPSATVLNDQGAPVLSPYDRLKVLQREYLQLSSIYSADHPDVQQIRRELEALGESTGLPAFDRATLESELQAREDQLAAARDRYAPDHPDVMRLERAVEAARQALAAAPRTRRRGACRRRPTTRPISSARCSCARRRSICRPRSSGATSCARATTELEKRLQVTPEVEREYSALIARPRAARRPVQRHAAEDQRRRKWR